MVTLAQPGTELNSICVILSNHLAARDFPYADLLTIYNLIIQMQLAPPGCGHRCSHSPGSSQSEVCVATDTACTSKLLTLLGSIRFVNLFIRLLLRIGSSVVVSSVRLRRFSTCRIFHLSENVFAGLGRLDGPLSLRSSGFICDVEGTDCFRLKLEGCESSNSPGES